MDRTFLLAALLLVTALAGCTDPDPDPDGGATTGPQGDTSNTSTRGSAGGTVGGGSGGSGGSGFAPQSHHARNDTTGRDGLVLEGNMTACDDGLCISVEARNEGTTTYHVSNICVLPWSDRMEQDGRSVVHREPVAHCMAFGTKPFAPGDSIPFVASWDQTLWNDDTQSAGPAPQGGYQWIAEFVSYTSDGGDGRHTGTLEFPAFVGPT